MSLPRVQLEPSSCLCPDRVEYQCHVYNAHILSWHNSHNQFNNIKYDSRDSVGKTFVSDLVTAKLTGKVSNMLQSINYTSTLRVHRYQLNETVLTCAGLLFHGNGAIKSLQTSSTYICITGNSIFNQI